MSRVSLGVDPSDRLQVGLLLIQCLLKQGDVFGSRLPEGEDFLKLCLKLDTLLLERFNLLWHHSISFEVTEVHIPRAQLTQEPEPDQYASRQAHDQKSEEVLFQPTDIVGQAFTGRLLKNCHK